LQYQAVRMIGIPIEHDPSAIDYEGVNAAMYEDDTEKSHVGFEE
jgi:hypothetical protein